MKKNIFILLGIFYFSNLLRSQTFEGEYVYHIDFPANSELSTDYTIVSNGQKFKTLWSMQGRKIEMIALDGNQNLMIMPDQKMAMKTGSNNPMMNKGAGPIQKEMQCSSQPGSGTKNIAGHSCKEYISKCTDKQGKTSTITFYHTTEISMPKTYESLAESSQQGLPKSGGAILEMSMETEGKVVMKMTVKGITPRKVLASEFEVPAGFQIMDTK